MNSMIRTFIKRGLVSPREMVKSARLMVLWGDGIRCIYLAKGSVETQILLATTDTFFCGDFPLLKAKKAHK